MTEHVLKIHEQPFNDLMSGAKTAEVRNNDRGFQVGDIVRLREIYDGSEAFTGREMRRLITHVQTDYGLPDNRCVLSYAPNIDALNAGQGEAVEKRLLQRLVMAEPYLGDKTHYGCDPADDYKAYRLELSIPTPALTPEPFGVAAAKWIRAAPPVSADAVSVPRELLEIEWLEHWLLFAAEPIGQECCNRPGLECCGCPDTCYRTADDITAAMNARHEELRALLAQGETK